MLLSTIESAAASPEYSSYLRYRSQQIEQTDFKYQTSDNSCYKHRYQCDGSSYSEHQQSAFLESGYQILTGRSSYFG